MNGHGYVYYFAVWMAVCQAIYIYIYMCLLAKAGTTLHFTVWV